MSFHVFYILLYVSVGMHLLACTVCVGVEGNWSEITERLGLFGWCGWGWGFRDLLLVEFKQVIEFLVAGNGVFII